MKKILITGASGYLGQIVYHYLKFKGYDIIGLDNLLYNQRSTVPIIKGDITSISDMYKYTRNIDIVIALAGIVGDAACQLDEKETVAINEKSTKLLVDVCEHNKVKKIIFASTCSVYGDSDNEIIDELAETNPLSLYAETKRKSEKILFDNCQKVQPIILRFGTLFGWSPRMRLDLVVNIMTIMAMKENKIIVKGGKQWRPLIHVLDVAKAIWLVIKERLPSYVYNLSSYNYQIEQIAQEIALVKPVPIVQIEEEKDLRSYKVSAELIRSELDFRPLVSLKDGIKEIMENIHKIKNYKEDIYYNVKILEKFKTL